MKNTILFSSITLLALVAVSCTKEKASQPMTPLPPMEYVDMNDSAVRFGRSALFDLDGNGSADLGFGTVLVGDPLLQQDKRQWYAFGTFNTFFPVNNKEEMPFLRVNELVTVEGFAGYAWYNASSILLAQQVLTEQAPPKWEGTWKEATHRYFPLQIKRGDSLYNGWAEISFRTADDRLYLHRAAVSKVATAAVRTGQ